ncbi:MAG: CotH kinase family protein, partial [Clostridia bacterium]|nr:CotH kinase family protein [Clostridia bacterium]
LPGAHVIKAYATDGINESAVFTNSYFIATGLCDYQLPIMSFSIPIDDMFGGSGFYSNFMPSGDITAPRPRGLGMMEIFDENGVRVGYSNVEAAVSGNGSSHTAMKSIRLYYKGKLNEEGGRFGSLHYDLFAGLARDADGNPITSFDRLLLRNSGNDCGNSYIRDAYMQRVSSGLSVDTMATRSVLLFVNGEFFGVYNARERYSPEYVESHYGVDKDNVALLESDYSQVHTNQNAPFVLMSGEEADADDFNALVDYIRQNDMADPFHYEYVTALLDINSFIDMWVVHLYFNATDWPGNNIKVFRNNDPLDPSGMDTKWHFTLLDLDMGLSYFDYTSAAYDIFYSFNRGSVVGNMMCDLMENEDFKAQFFCRYVTLVNEYFTPGYLSEVFEELYSERSPLVTLQMARWGREGAHINTWLREAEKIRLFIKTRNEYAIKALYRHFGINESDMDALLYPRLSLIFNPAHVSVKVNGDEITKQTNLIAAWGEALLIELIPREGCSITETTVNFQTVRETTFTLTLTKDCTLRIQTEAEESTSQAPSG